MVRGLSRVSPGAYGSVAFGEAVAVSLGRAVVSDPDGGLGGTVYAYEWDGTALDWLAKSTGPSRRRIGLAMRLP